MPLIDLKTDLKTLQYGKDRPGGGWSGQPYMQFPIEDIGVPQNILDFYKSNRISLDYPVRGGGLKFDLGTQTFTLSSQMDKSRIKKFFEDKPRGAAFIQKQIGLQLSNPKVETGTSVYGLQGQSFLPGLIENTRIYNGGINTLAQVGVSGTGIHIPRIGTMPFNPTTKYYKDIVGGQNDENFETENRLINMYKLKMVSTQAQVNLTGVLSNIVKINQLGISTNRGVLFQYLGGPGSSYGIGSTTINRYDDTTKAQNATKVSSTYTDIMMRRPVGMPKVGSTYLDYRQTQYAQGYAAAVGVSGIQGLDGAAAENALKEQNIDYRFYNYDPESDVARIIDKVNSKDYLTTDSTNPWNDVAEEDMIKFGFECINNDNPSRSLFLQFRAFLTNGVTDNHQAAFNTFKYMGRGEDFFTYQGFSRAISFSFRVAVQSSAEMLPLYNKLNALVSLIYPDYSPKTNFMRSSVVKLTIGDYLFRVPGLLESVNVKIPQDSSWETDDSFAQLPHYLDVDVSFKPIMSQLPRKVITDDAVQAYAEDLTPVPGEVLIGGVGQNVKQMVTTQNAIIANKPGIVKEAVGFVDSGINNGLASLGDLAPKPRRRGATNIPQKKSTVRTIDGLNSLLTQL